jgi:hypothetical protein
MAVLAADANINWFGNPRKIAVPCTTADVFYKGAVVWALAAGKFGVAPAAGDRCIGICTQQVTTTAADQLVEIAVDGLFQITGTFTTATITVADCGATVKFGQAEVSDNVLDVRTIEDTALAANDAILGRIVSFLDSKIVIAIGLGYTGQLGIADATNAFKYQ